VALMSHFLFLDYTISGILSRVCYILSHILGGVLRFVVYIISHFMGLKIFFVEYYYIMRDLGVQVFWGLCYIV
jgi:hypothetical protein